MTRLSVVDNVVFGLMFVVSGAIGIYHAYTSKRQQTTSNYLLANRSMSTFPIAVSLLVSFLSAISILGIPSEVYTFGFAYVLVFVAFTLIFVMSAFLFVPVFYKLQITSTNEYLEMRFSPGIRLCGCILFVITYTLYLSIALYAPALALEAVSGLSMLISISVNGIVCVFYTTLGGLRAVIWTDVFQALVILVGMVSVFVAGTLEVGGFSEVWEKNKLMNRTEIFNFDPDPTVRSTFWTLIVGGTFTYIFSWSTSQLSVQRFLAAKTLKQAQRAVLMNIPIFIFVASILCLDGLVIFAVYAECDLVKAGKITKNDQIVPYFVVDKLGHLKGMPGLFIASLFSGCLSTVSSGINSLSTILLEDILKKIKKDIPETKATFLSKLIGVIYGVVIILGAIVLKYVKVALLIQLTASLFNISAGPLLGIFILGMVSKRANWKGAYIGQLVGLGLTLWIYCGTFSYPPNRYTAPVSVKNCSTLNLTTNGSAKIPEDYIIQASFKEHSEPLAKLYGLSFYYYGAVGTLTTVLVGLIFSYILETSDDRERQVDERLLFHVKWPELKKTRSVNVKNHSADTTTVLEKYSKNDIQEHLQLQSVVNKGFAEN